MRFGVGEKGEHTLEQVGDHFAVTRERARQIEAKALDRLRRGGGAQDFKLFFDPLGNFSPHPRSTTDPHIFTTRYEATSAGLVPEPKPASKPSSSASF